MDTELRRDDKQEVLQLLHRASQSAEDALAQHLVKAGITPRQFTVLRAAAGLKSSSQTALVSQTGIDRSTLADIVRRLVDAGLVKRERTAEDARMYAIEITPDGERMLATIAPDVRDVGGRILDLVDEADRPALLRALSAIVENLGPVASARVSERAKSLRQIAEIQSKPADPTDVEAEAASDKDPERPGEPDTPTEPRSE